MSLKFYRASNLFYDPPSRLRQTWRAGKNQLVKVVKSNGDTVEYTYDGEGKRYSRKVIPADGGTSASGSAAVSTYYQYDANGNIVLETDSSKNIKAKYIRDNQGKVLALELPTPDYGLRTYYYLYNAHGDVTGLTDSQGNVVATYTYDEFGNLKSSTGSIYNPLRYSGANNAYYDSETGLYKMGVRYYDSSIGRWITRDTLKNDEDKTQTQMNNKYAYVVNNPTTKIDSSGETAVSASGKHHIRYTSWWKLKDLPDGIVINRLTMYWHIYYRAKKVTYHWNKISTYARNHAGDPWHWYVKKKWKHRSKWNRNWVWAKAYADLRCDTGPWDPFRNQYWISLYFKASMGRLYNSSFRYKFDKTMWWWDKPRHRTFRKTYS